MYNLESRLKDD